VVSSGTPISSTNKADRHDISEIFLKVASNTITLTLFLLILYNSSKAGFELTTLAAIDSDCI
jgi:hypothetical protein